MLFAQQMESDERIRTFMSNSLLQTLNVRVTRDSRDLLCEVLQAMLKVRSMRVKLLAERTSVGAEIVHKLRVLEGLIRRLVPHRERSQVLGRRRSPGEGMQGRGRSFEAGSQHHICLLLGVASGEIWPSRTSSSGSTRLCFREEQQRSAVRSQSWSQARQAVSFPIRRRRAFISSRSSRETRETSLDVPNPFENHFPETAKRTSKTE